MDPLIIASGISLTKEAVKALVPLAINLLETWKQHGEFTPEQEARLIALNQKTEADYVRDAGGNA